MFGGKGMKKILAIILSLIMLLPLFSLAASAAQYSDIPCVIVPGIGQSRAWLVDKNGHYVLNGNGEKIHCFPGNFDIQKILSDVAAPLAMSVSTHSDAGLSDALCKALDNAFYMNKTDDNAVPCGYVEVETYPHSIAECTEDQRQYIFDCIPMQDLGETIGFENMYYYAYNSFGNALDMIEGLYKYIQLVKRQTGKDKVNIIPISMGGAIFNGLMELHPEVADDLHRIIFVVPALNGSLIVSDIDQKQLTFLNADYLYSEFFDGILDETTASAIEVAIRVLPKDVLMSTLNKAVDMLIKDVFANCTGLWMLVPNDQYAKCVQMTLSDSSKAEVRRQTDIYHNAQSNSNKNILAFKSRGVEIFDVLGYDVPLYNVGNSWNTQNADGVIHTYSTSMGAYMANVGETLPADYVQKNPYASVSGVQGIQSINGSIKRLFSSPSAPTALQCSDPTHNHISPDRVVDASTGLLPDHTFYFDNQAHATANQNDIIMKLCCELVESDRIKDVYSDENYPQFNVGRATKVLREELLPAAENVDRTKLNRDDTRELSASVREANDMLSRTVAVEGEAPAVEQRLRSILEKVGAVEPASDNSQLASVFRTISDTLMAVGGANGYTDMIRGVIPGLPGQDGNENADGSSDNANGSSGGGSNSGSASGGNSSASASGKTVAADTKHTAGSAKSPKTSGKTVSYAALSVVALGSLSAAVTVIIKKKKDETE